MEINKLPHYPRFVFNCSDGKCFSTMDLDQLEFIKSNYKTAKLESLNTGSELKILWAGEEEYTLYKISKIDIRDIKYDTEDKLYGSDENDCSSISGKEKNELMAIFIFLDKINKE